MLGIVIPYYKITFFDETLDSLSKQSDKRFKVYIGDDASLEDPAFLLQKYNGQFDFFYHLFAENLGSVSVTGFWFPTAFNGFESEILLSDFNSLAVDSILISGANALVSFDSEFETFSTIE